MNTNYFTSTADIKVSKSSIVFYTLNGVEAAYKSDAKYGQILKTVMRQLKCGPTTADFLAAQHVFVEEGEMLAWFAFFMLNDEEIYTVDGKSDLFETYIPAEISDKEIAECLAEDLYDRHYLND